VTLDLFAERGATMSPDRVYRYRLWRTWGDPSQRIVFVGLNPSTADESEDDPTIRKCIGFGKRWGFGRLDMLNLFAVRSTDPGGLPTDLERAIGPCNDEALTSAMTSAARVVWAWGSPALARVRRMIAVRLDFWVNLPAGTVEHGTLGPRLLSGAPRHPLMLAYSTPFLREGSVTAGAKNVR